MPNDYYEEVQNMSTEQVDAFIKSHINEPLKWDSFLMYIDLSYDYPEIDDEIKSRMIQYHLYHYDSCYMLSQYYDSLLYKKIRAIIPKHLQFLPQPFFCEGIKEFSFTHFDKAIENCEYFLKLSVDDLKLTLNNETIAETLYMRYILLLIIYIVFKNNQDY